MQLRYSHIISSFATLAVFFLFTGAKCNKETGDCHHKIKLINNSNSTIYVMGSIKYPDTTIQDPNPYGTDDSYKIAPNSTGSALTQTGCIEDQFDFTFPGGKTVIFIFEVGLFQSNSWQTIKQNGLYSKRYILSLDSLKAINFTITYP